MMRIAIALLLFATTATAQELASALREVIDAPAYKGARWGILVTDSKTGATIYSRNADTLFAPASVTKLYSCAAALVALGPDHRFETPVYALGDVKDKKLTGNLVLVASGDLTFGSRIGKNGKTEWKDNDHIYTDGYSTGTQLTETNPVAAFDELARQIKKSGIDYVEGDVLIDDRLFNISTGSGSGPRVVSPMMANDNLIDLIVTPGEKEGDPAKVTMRPETAYLRTDFDITTGGTGARFSIEADTDTIYSLRGRIAAGSKPIVRIVPINDPAAFARTLFIEALRREGVRVKAALVRHPEASELPKAKEYESLKPVAVFKSAPLSETIEVVLKVSHNLYASALPHLVAVKKDGGKTLTEGLRAQRGVLKEIGVPVDTISFGGGAGGENADHVSPRATVALLQAMMKRPEWEKYKAALPILGVDGTLASAVEKDSPAKGKVFAKTGTLGWDDRMNARTYLTSKALAGVMTTRSGTELTICLFLNDLPMPMGARSSREGKTLGKLCEILFEKGP